MPNRRYRDACRRGALAAILSLAMAGAAAADCYVNGQWVAEGSRLGDQVCQNGEWVPG